MRSEKVKEGSGTNIVTNSMKKNKKKRRQWLPFRRGKMEERKVNIIVDDQYGYTSAFSQSSLPAQPHSLLSSTDETKNSYDTPVYGRDPRYSTDEILVVESRIQNYLRELTIHIPEARQAPPISNGSPSLSKVGNIQNVKLTTNAGVLIFDGVDEGIPDDNSFQKIVAEEQKSRNQGVRKTSTTDFVVAPKDYDPIASGFYKPKRVDRRTFYESDEEDYLHVCQQPKVTVGIEIVLQDGSLSVLA